MRSSDKLTQFPQQSDANPGHKDIQHERHKEKFIRNPSRGPLKKKSKSKGKA